MINTIQKKNNDNDKKKLKTKTIIVVIIVMRRRNTVIIKRRILTIRWVQIMVKVIVIQKSIFVNERNTKKFQKQQTISQAIGNAFMMNFLSGEWFLKQKLNKNQFNTSMLDLFFSLVLIKKYILLIKV